MVITHVAKGEKLSPAEYDASTGTHNPPYPHGTSYFVISNGAAANLKTWGTWMRAAGHPVWVCDGTADEVEWQAAIDAGVTAGIGFTLWASPGSYTFAGNIEKSLANFNKIIVIEGYGAEITYSGGAGVGTLYLRDRDTAGWNLGYLILRGFKMTGTSGIGGIVLKSVTNVLIEDIQLTGFTNATYGAIHTLDGTGEGLGEYITIRRCHLWDNKYGVYLKNANGGSASFTLEDTAIEMNNIADAGAVGLNLAGLTVARSHFRNVMIHCGGADGQTGVVVDTNVNGSIFDVLGFDEHSASNGMTAILTTANAAGTLYVNGLQGSTVGGVLTFRNTSLGSLSLKIRGSDSYVTEKSGTGTIANAATSAVITHGLSYTPTAKNITVTLTENPTNTPGAIWVDTITSTQFTVNCENDPGASGLDFSWAVREV